MTGKNVLNKEVNVCGKVVGGLNVTGKNVLNKEVNVCGKVVGERQELLSELYERRVVGKARVIVDGNSHVLAKCCDLIPTGRRFSRTEI